MFTFSVLKRPTLLNVYLEQIIRYLCCQFIGDEVKHGISIWGLARYIILREGTFAQVQTDVCCTGTELTFDLCVSVQRESKCHVT